MDIQKILTSAVELNYQNSLLVFVRLSLLLLTIIVSATRLWGESIIFDQVPTSREIFIFDAVDFKEVELGSGGKFNKSIVSIRNRNRETWTGVKVIFRLPSGKQFLAKGASTISPGRQATYALQQDQLEADKTELVGTELNFLKPEVIVSYRQNSINQN